MDLHLSPQSHSGDVQFVHRIRRVYQKPRKTIEKYLFNNPPGIERGGNCKRSDNGREREDSPRRNSDDAIDVAIHGSGVSRGPFNRLTSATRKIHSAGVPRKAQIPSRASTCPVASFLESWPGRACGRARIFKAGGRFLLSCCSIRRRERSLFLSCLLFSPRENEDTRARNRYVVFLWNRSRSSRHSSADYSRRVFLRQVAFSRLSHRTSTLFNVWHFWHYGCPNWNHNLLEFQFFFQRFKSQSQSVQFENIWIVPSSQLSGFVAEFSNVS